jgi:hypothetical protein
VPAFQIDIEPRDQFARRYAPYVSAPLKVVACRRAIKGYNRQGKNTPHTNKGKGVT